MAGLGRKSLRHLRGTYFSCKCLILLICTRVRFPLSLSSGSSRVVGIELYSPLRVMPASGAVRQTCEAPSRRSRENGRAWPPFFCFSGEGQPVGPQCCSAARWDPSGGVPHPFAAGAVWVPSAVPGAVGCRF